MYKESNIGKGARQFQGLVFMITIEDEGEEQLVPALLVHLRSDKTKTRNDALSNLKIILDDEEYRPANIDELKEVQLSVMRYCQMELKGGRQISDATVLERERRVGQAARWSLSLLDRFHPSMIVSSNLVRSILEHYLSICQQCHLTEVLSSINLYLLSKREYLLSIDDSKHFLSYVLPRDTLVDRREYMNLLCYLSLLVTSSFEILEVMMDLLKEVIAGRSVSEDYTLMLGLRHINRLLARLQHHDLLLFHRYSEQLRDVLVGLERRQLYVDQEIVKFMKMSAVDCSVLFPSLSIPPHLEQLDPIELAMHFRHEASSNEVMLYLTYYFELKCELVYNFKARKVDASFVETFYCVITNKVKPTYFDLNNAALVNWYLTMPLEIRFEDLRMHFFRKSSSRYAARLILHQTNESSLQQQTSLIEDVFVTGAPVQSNEFLQLYLSKFASFCENWVDIRQAKEMYARFLNWIYDFTPSTLLIECIRLPIRYTKQDYYQETLSMFIERHKTREDALLLLACITSSFYGTKNAPLEFDKKNVPLDLLVYLSNPNLIGLIQVLAKELGTEYPKIDLKNPDTFLYLPRKSIKIDHLVRCYEVLLGRGYEDKLFLDDLKTFIGMYLQSDLASASLHPQLVNQTIWVDARDLATCRAMIPFLRESVPEHYLELFKGEKEEAKLLERILELDLVKGIKQCFKASLQAVKQITFPPRIRITHTFDDTSLDSLNVAMHILKASEEDNLLDCLHHYLLKVAQFKGTESSMAAIRSTLKEFTAPLNPRKYLAALLQRYNHDTSLFDLDGWKLVQYRSSILLVEDECDSIDSLPMTLSHLLNNVHAFDLSPEILDDFTLFCLTKYVIALSGTKHVKSITRMICAMRKEYSREMASVCSRMLRKSNLMTLVGFLDANEVEQSTQEIALLKTLNEICMEGSLKLLHDVTVLYKALSLTTDLVPLKYLELGNAFPCKHESEDLIVRQMLLMNPELMSCVSAELLTLVKDDLHRYLLGCCAKSNETLFFSLFVCKLTTELLANDLVRLEKPNKEHFISSAFSDKELPLHWDPKLRLYLAALCSEYKPMPMIEYMRGLTEFEGMIPREISLLAPQLEQRIVKETVTRSLWLTKRWEMLEEMDDVNGWDAVMVGLLLDKQIDKKKYLDQEQKELLSELDCIDLGKDTLRLERLALSTEKGASYDLVNRIVKKSHFVQEPYDALRILESKGLMDLRMMAGSKLLWKTTGRQQDALRLLQEGKRPEDGHLQCLWLVRQAKWSHHLRAKEFSHIESHYIIPLKNLLVDNLRAKCYLKLAKLYDNVEEFSRIEAEIREKRRLIRQSEMTLVSTSKRTLLANKADSGEARKLLQLHGTELQAIRMEREMRKVSAMTCYINVLAYSNGTLKQDMAIHRLVSLWMDSASDESICTSVRNDLVLVPYRYLVPLAFLLMARLDGGEPVFQATLRQLVTGMCQEMMHHCIYTLLFHTRMDAKRAHDDKALSASLIMADLMQRDVRTQRFIEVAKAFLHAIDAIDRVQAGELIAQRKEWSIPRDSKLHRKDLLHGIPMISLQQSLHSPPTIFMQELGKKSCKVYDGLSHPRLLEMLGSDGLIYRMFLKNNDELRQDAVVERVFRQVQRLLSNPDLLQCYHIVPLQPRAGIIECVPGAACLEDLIRPLHQLKHPTQPNLYALRDKMRLKAGDSLAERRAVFDQILSTYSPTLRHLFVNCFNTPQSWYSARLLFTGSTAVTGVLGWVIGLGDRHLRNILLDTRTGKLILIDLNMIFDQGMELPVPERVPFRLTQNIVDGLLGVWTPNPDNSILINGPLGSDMRHALEVLRRHSLVVLNILDLFRYDPALRWAADHSWKQNLEAARQKLYPIQPSDHLANTSAAPFSTETHPRAELALARVKKRLLSQELGLQAQISKLIEEARSADNLAQMYHGWTPFA